MNIAVSEKKGKKTQKIVSDLGSEYYFYYNKWPAEKYYSIYIILTCIEPVLHGNLHLGLLG
jgi:hypothetical protein